MDGLVGPILGQTTTSTAQVWARVYVDNHGSPEIKLSASLGEVRIREQIDLKTSNDRKIRVTVFEISSLSSGTEVEYSLTSVGKHIRGPFRFRTREDSVPARVNIFLGSCSDARHKHAGDVDPRITWGRMQRTARASRIDLVALLGDQVYADGIRHTQSSEDIRNAYAMVYRSQWPLAHTRVLAEVPTVMMWDDHDIRDDAGTKPSDEDEYQKMRREASTLFDSHQGIHHRPLALTSTDLAATLPYPEDSLGQVDRLTVVELYGNVAMVLLDGRTFRDRAGTVLVDSQLAALRDLVDNGLPNVETLVISTGVPLALFSAGLPDGLDTLSDFADQWGTPKNRAQQIEIANLLFDWQLTSVKRRVILVGGDTHVFAKGLITRHDSDRPIPTIIASGLRRLIAPGKPWLTRKVAGGLRTFMRKSHSVGGSMMRVKYDHNSLTAAPNFVHLELSKTPLIPHRAISYRGNLKKLSQPLSKRVYTLE